MKNKIIILLLIQLFLIGLAGAQTNNYPQITEISCGLNVQCPENLGCYGFPNIGRRCAEKNPCSYFKCPENTECRLTDSYPGSVVCGGRCIGDECEKGISYDAKTGKVEVTQNNKKTNVEITIKSTPGSNGILETPTVSAVTYKEVIIEDSKLIMKTSSGNKQINVLPEDAVSKSETPNSAKEIILKEESQKPIYYIKGKKRARMLFVFPVELDIETKIDAGNGNVVSVKKPWWSFLTK